jgi:hypothetical protein
VPIGLGHFAYDQFLAVNKSLEGAVIVVVVALTLGGIYEFGQSRRIVMATGESPIDQQVLSGWGCAGYQS